MKRDNPHEAPSTVCLDSVEIRRIRESQQLTQLYVSKVVGVTTDTISRWENNRYPTIRRENALKLAEALEVPLEAILQKPAAEAVVEIESSSWSPVRLWGWLGLALFVLLMGGYLVLSKSPPPPPAVSAERLLPKFAGPGSEIPVQITLTYRAETGGIILRENIPKGWKIVQADPPASSLDNVNGVARWILKPGDDRNRVAYLVRVDPAAKVDAEGQFGGEIVASREGSQSAVTVQGDSQLRTGSVHWADADGDGRIDDGEMLQASFTIEDMGSVHIDWHELEKLWAAGGYRWDDKKERFVPAPQG